MSAKAGSVMEQIERVHPGYKVVAGPFNTGESAYGRDYERELCKLAFQQQRNAGVEAKVILWRGQTYVLRTEAGWITHDGGCQSEAWAERRESGQGYRCPLCHTGPYLQQGLRIHQCPQKPMVRINGRLRRGRLEPEDIERAMAGGERQTQKEGQV